MVTLTKGSLAFKGMKTQGGIGFLELQVTSVTGHRSQGHERQGTKLQL